jgi:phage terminase small subunit
LIVIKLQELKAMESSISKVMRRVHDAEETMIAKIKKLENKLKKIAEDDLDIGVAKFKAQWQKQRAKLDTKKISTVQKKLTRRAKDIEKKAEKKYENLLARSLI